MTKDFLKNTHFWAQGSLFFTWKGGEHKLYNPKYATPKNRHGHQSLNIPIFFQSEIPQLQASDL